MIPQEGFKNRPKLLAGSKVEVRSVEDGFQGSWHIAKVLVCDNQIRVVEYENLLRDDGSSEKLVESVKVSAIIDGNIPADLGPSTNYRGLIRPSPPQIVFDKWGLHYGLCVDVYTEDAWWEGVIFDHDDGSEERLVFFPDIGDDMRARVDMLRFTQDWDEATEDWKRRENWVFLELIEEVEQEWPLLVSVKQIWYEVRRKKGFENLKEWTFRMKRIWKGLVLGVISDNFKLTLKDFFRKMNSLEELVQEVLPSLDLTELSLHAVVKSQVDSCESLAVVPFDLDVTSCEPAEEEIQYSEPPGFSKVPSNLYEALSIGSNIKPEGIIGKICSFRKLTPSKHVLKNEWLPAGSDLVHEAEFCPYAITEYYNLYKSSRPPDALKFKARQHLSYMGWKIEFMRLHNGSNKFRYTSPCGEVYFSLYQLCKELSNSLSEEISVIPSTRQFSPAVIENLAYENACSETPPSEATVSGIGSEVLKICSTLPPNADELLSVTSNNKHKILFFTSSEIPEQKINQEAVPAGSDLLSKAEVCANAFTQCLEVYKSGGRTCGVRVSKEIKFNVREHLLCLGWKIKCRINDKGRERIRYIAPNGYSYYSLRKICEHWNTDSSKFPPERTSHSSVREALFSPAISAERRQLKKRRSEPSTSAPPVVEPNYSPQAVHDYYYLPELEQVTDFRKVKRDAKLKQLGLKAKQHLASLNWSFFYSSSGDRKELKYLSPTGKKFHNLRKACQNCLKEGGACVDEAYDLGQRQNIGVSRENNRQLAIEGRCSPLRDSASTSSSRKIVEMSNTKEVRIRKLRFEGDNGVFSLNASMLQSENQNSSSPMANVEKESGTGTGRVLRSSKRVRDVASPLHQTPRTVLSWLMENNVVLPRTKVQYRMKDNSAMAEGRVTRDGIKCSCCQNVFTLGNFEAHAGSSDRQPSANIFLEDGRSLLDCQMQLKRVIDVKRSRTGPRRGVKGSRHHSKNDYICSVCHFGGELVLCDQCPSSFHTDCLGLQEVPEGDWFCPLCCCRICGQSGFNRSSEHFTSSTSLNCEQCQRQYHVGCLNEKCHTKLESYPRGNWFCNIRCEEIFMGLQKLLGKAIPVGMNMLKWTLLKYTESNFDSHDAFDTEELESYSKLNVALSVMHECFEPVKEPSTRRDLVEDVIFCKRSELNRLNFRGFYTVLLERDDELITVATIRVYGEKVAEVPLVATRFPYRRLGMCRILMNELEKKLMELGVERLVLPSVPGVLNTWTTAFGFSMMTKSERLNFLDYTFLDFQGTFMCQKLLQKTPSSETSLLRATLLKLCHGDNAKDPMDLDGNSAVSEVVQSERIEESRVLDQGSSDIPRGDDCSDGQIGSKPLDLMENQSSRTECQSQISMAYLVVDSEKECETSGNNGSFKCYKRRKMAAAYGS